MQVYLQWLVKAFGKLLLPIHSHSGVVLALQLFLDILFMLVVLQNKLIDLILLIIVCNVSSVAHTPSGLGVESFGFGL